MKEIFKIGEINFETNLKLSEIIKIAKTFVDGKDEPYEINEECILYDIQSHVNNEAVWYVNVISLRVKQRWPEAYDTLAISDQKGRVIYVMNDHGVVIEKF